jgi:hypothetical protein
MQSPEEQVLNTDDLDYAAALQVCGLRLVGLFRTDENGRRRTVFTFADNGRAEQLRAEFEADRLCLPAARLLQCRKVLVGKLHQLDT